MIVELSISVDSM